MGPLYLNAENKIISKKDWTADGLFYAKEIIINKIKGITKVSHFPHSDKRAHVWSSPFSTNTKKGLDQMWALLSECERT